MKLSITIANIFLLAAILTGTYFYITEGTLVLKAITSALFTVTGLLNYVYIKSANSKSSSFSLLMLCALFFSMLGDIALNLNFISGAALFAVGHIFYALAYGKIRRFDGIDFALGAIIFVGAGAFLLFSGMVSFSSDVLRYACLLYALIISMMLAKAICNFINIRNILSTVIAIGSSLFFFSDLMLALDTFTNAQFPSGVLCLSTYYPAQWLLAFSILLTSIKAASGIKNK